MIETDNMPERTTRSGFFGHFSKREVRNANVSHLFFYIGYGLWLVAAILTSTLFVENVPTTELRFLGLGFLALGELTRKEYPKHYFAILAATVFSSMIANSHSFGSLSDVLILLFCARDRNFRTIAKVTVGITSTLMTITVLSAFTGIIPNYVSVSEGRIRYYLGFRYALYSSQLIFNITALVLYLNQKNLKYRHALYLIILNYWVYSLTNSRLSFYLSIFLIVSVIFVSSSSRAASAFSKFKWVLVTVYLWSATISIGISWLYSNDSYRLATLDRWFNHRLQLGNAAIQNYGVTLLGQQIELYGNGLDRSGRLPEYTRAYYNYIDSLYVRLLVQYGVVLLLAFLIAMTVVSCLLYKHGSYVLLLVVAAFAVHSMVDDLSILFQYNTTLFLIGTLSSATQYDKVSPTKTRFREKSAVTWPGRSSLAHTVRNSFDRTPAV
jgi:hypothetical protein